MLLNRIGAAMDYRKAGIEDADELSRLRVEMLLEEDPYDGGFQSVLYKNTKQYILEELKDGSFSAWVAVEGSLILAMGGAAYFTLPPNSWCPAGKTAYIGNLYTLPGYRGQGIASRLLELITAEAKDRGCQRILLTASAMGRPLYEKAGFCPGHDAMALYPFGIKENT